MKYIIMLMIIVGLALADYLTGIIKAYCNSSISSSKMRKGGLNKLAEIIVMSSAVGLDVGINALGEYYGATEISGVAGAVTAFMVFAYIALMEVVSIFENYAEINPEAQWAVRIIRKLKNFNEVNENDNKK